MTGLGLRRTFLSILTVFLASTASLPAAVGRPLPVVVQRTPPRFATGAEATNDDERPAPVRLILLDGRTIAENVPLSTAFRAGIDPESLKARRLGPRATDPILVNWTDYSQGQGNYQQEFYVVLPGGEAAEPLLRGALDISGNSGVSNWASRKLSIRLEGEILIRRIELNSSYSRTDPSPGCRPIANEPRVFECEEASAVESRYRLRGETVEPIAFEELIRLEPGVDPAPLLRDGWRAVGGASPRVGGWLRKALPLAEGISKYPAKGPLEVEP